MEILKAIILGIIQGLTEFLPVSSSGHLEIAKCIFSSEILAKESMLMTVVLHFATALSTIVIFRKDLVEIFSGLFQFKNNESFWFSVKIILSMVPAVFVGLFFENEIEALFGGQLILVGCMLLITALLLFLADKAKYAEKTVGIKDAILIGISQAIAILPGISRSGATISTAVLLGIDKEKAARFSFLMVVPLILGKMAKDIFSGEISYESSSFLPLLVGFIFAFFTGLIACKWMIKLVKNSQLKYFAYYCFAVGVIVILLFVNSSFPCQ
ncbi:MAG: undecaprenyl-diphosphate phosphatase [Flavobacteriales bacterium]|nr:undecaprenyl-diphosphate phosphatase [Flavobacteriales bacterium]